MPATETILIPPYGHTLAGTLREILANGIASRIELKPQSPFAGDPEFDSSSLAAWTQKNASSADTIDAHTTRKSCLYINLNATNSDAASGVVVHQTLSGDFDVYTRIEWGNARNIHYAGITAESTARADDQINAIVYTADAGTAGSVTVDLNEQNNGVGADLGNAAIGANTMTNGGFVWVRLKRVTNDFSGYFSLDGKTWTLIYTQTRADFSSDAKVGPKSGNLNTGNAYAGAFDFVRTWPPYVTTSPVSTFVLDSGAPGTVWTPSTFAALENPPLDPFGIQAAIGLGTLKYRLAASDTNPPTLAGGTLTEAQVQALSALTGRYLQIEVTYISANGYELAAFAGAKIQRSIVTSGVSKSRVIGGV